MGFMAYFNGNSDPHEVACKDPDSIGSILREWGYVTDDELEKAVKIQKSQQQLGQILIDLTDGRLTNEQVEEAFMEQKIRRRKASHREITAFNSRKKRRLVSGIQTEFATICTKLDEVAT
jgi:hypothetical protein